MYRPKLTYIQQRHEKLTQQMTRLGEEIEQNLLVLQHDIQQWQPSIDFHNISAAIDECVKHGQQRSRQEFEYKKQMLTYNWNDHQLLRKFYQFTPNDEQIELAKKIWQTIAEEMNTKEQLEILRQRIYLNHLPSQTDQMVNQLLDDHQSTLSNPFLEPQQRASFASRCSKTIIQCKFNLMIVQIDELETVLRRQHQRLTNLQTLLTQLNKEKPHIYTITFKDLIEERRQAMIQRLICIREHKLKTFFDEAPTVATDN